MKKATAADKSLVIDLLSASFTDNKSVNYIIRQDKTKLLRLKALMDYSFEVCRLFGQVYLSEDNKACALILYPDQKRTNLTAIWLDVKLIFKAIGIRGIAKALKREAAIKAMQPKIRMSYLWFIGVAPPAQHRGTGTDLLKEIIREAKAMHRPLYLETSTERNIRWYEQLGFRIYNRLDLGYTLYFLRQTNS